MDAACLAASYRTMSHNERAWCSGWPAYMQNRDVNRNVNTGDRDLGDKVQDKWHDFRAAVREKWNDLTDRDIDQYKGRDRNEFVGYIGERTGSRREEIDRDIDSLSRNTGYRFD